MGRFKANFWVKDDRQFLTYIQECNYATISADESIKTSSIPKIAHFIWLGPNPLPQYAQYCIQSFITHHPDWTYKVWRDEDTINLKREADFPSFSFLSSPHFNYGIKSDLLRYELLRRYGGVYIDMDYEFLQSLDHVVLSSHFFCGLSNTDTVEVNNGIIGAVPHHPLIEQVNQVACQRLSEYQKKEVLPFLPNEVVMSFLSAAEKQRISDVIREKLLNQTIVLTGPGLLTTALFDFLSSHSLEQRNHIDSRVLVLPTVSFSAIPNKSMVSLSRVIDPSLIGSMTLQPLSREDWKRNLLSYDYHLFYEHRLHEVEGMGPDEVNWRSYEQVKQHSLESTTNHLPLATAIHWWQRSWQ